MLISDWLAPIKIMLMDTLNIVLVSASTTLLFQCVGCIILQVTIATVIKLCAILLVNL